MADEVAVVVETEKILDGLVLALRHDWYTSAFSLQTKYLSSYLLENAGYEKTGAEGTK